MTDIAISTTNRAAFEARDWVLFTSLSLIWGASFLFIAIGLEAFHPGLITWARVGLGAAALGVVGTGLAFAIMATLIGRVGGPRASFITYLIPAVSLVLGVVFLGDRVTALALVGVALTIAGPILAARREA